MIQLLMILSLTPAAQPQVAQFKPCVWPNTCNVELVAAAKPDFEICLAPRKCGRNGTTAVPAVTVAQFKPCVWPNTCGGKDQVVTPVVAQFRPCVWPNTCGAAMDEKI